VGVATETIGRARQAQAKAPPFASSNSFYSDDKAYWIRDKVKHFDVESKVIHILSRVQVLNAKLEYLQVNPGKDICSN
jgi:hypothetical protein